jgi:hypothetical protein
LPNQYVHPSILSGLTGNRAAPVGVTVQDCGRPTKP